MAEEQEEDERERGKVNALIETATNSTEPEVDPRLLKAIKMVVRYSDLEVRFAASTLMDLMKRQHSQIRYLSLLIIDELFMRSKLFRTLIAENLDQLLTLSVGFRRNQPLPAPPSVASVLRSKAIEFLEKWNSSFGIHYRQLRLGYDYLKNTLRYQFPNLQENAARIQQERRERELRTKQILRNKFETLRENLASIREEIQSTIDEIGECLEVVRANDETFLVMEPLYDDDEEEFEEIRNPELRQIRLNSLKEAEKVYENSENKVVFDALRELYKLLVTKHLVSIQQWISLLIRVEVDDTRFRDNTLKELIDFKNRILAAKKKCEESGCALPNTTGSEEDDIWEEGKIDFVESSSKDSTEVLTANEISTKDVPECSNRGANDREIIKSKQGGEGSNSLRSKLFAKAPVVKWGSSLDNWGEKRDVLVNQRGLELDGHWGRVDYDATIPAEKIAELNVHATLYQEEQTEIQQCQAPLSKGGLCQRRDLRVCPFHGPIIPRDDEGRPLKSLDDEKISMMPSSMTEEMYLDEKGDLDEELAKQAVKNVRERDKEEAKKKQIDKKAVKRAKLAKIREHNEAVLREAAMVSTSRSTGIGGFEGGSSGERASGRNKKSTLASMLRKKVTAKDRIAERLLSTRARDATIKQLSQAEDTNYRESFPNQW